MPATSAPKIRLAVVGGGLAGASMANALYKLPHLDVHIYEAAAEFSERGAAVGLGDNALVALNDLIPGAQELVLDKAGAVPMNSTRLVIGSGLHAGTVVMDLQAAGKKEPGRVVHRAALLNALLSPIPQAMQHVNKKLSSIIQKQENVELNFEDGTMEIFHAVIGADGIFGSVRTHVLQGNAEEHQATPAGFWDCRYLVPFDKAREKLGKEYFEDHRQYGWCGDGAFIMHDVLDNGATVQCVISAVEKEPPKDRSRPLTRDILNATLRNWLDGPIAKNMIDLVLESEDLKMYSQWEHKSTPTYANGQVCIMGDAAHATSPWQGSGAAMALEDAVVLGALLRNAKTPADVKPAFQAYGEARRDRGQRVIDSSRTSGRYMCGQGEAAAADPGKLLQLLGQRWDFISNFDLQKQKDDAVKRAEELKAA